MTTKQDEIDALRARLAEAEAELEAWRTYDATDSDTLEEPARILRKRLGLRNHGTAKTALALYNAPLNRLSIESLARYVPPLNEGRDDVRFFSAEICYLRRAIGFDAVTTLRGWGYQLTAKGRETIRRALSEKE